MFKEDAEIFGRWFMLAAVTSNGPLVVPEYIQELPCGCRREGKTKLVLIKKGGGWVHDTFLCWDKDLLKRLPSAVPNHARS